MSENYKESLLKKEKKQLEEEKQNAIMDRLKTMLGEVAEITKAKEDIDLDDLGYILRFAIELVVNGYINNDNFETLLGWMEEIVEKIGGKTLDDLQNFILVPAIEEAKGEKISDYNFETIVRWTLKIAEKILGRKLNYGDDGFESIFHCAEIKVGKKDVSSIYENLKPAQSIKEEGININKSESYEEGKSKTNSVVNKTKEKQNNTIMNNFRSIIRRHDNNTIMNNLKTMLNQVVLIAEKTGGDKKDIIKEPFLKPILIFAIRAGGGSNDNFKKIEDQISKIAEKTYNDKNYFSSAIKSAKETAREKGKIGISI